MADSGVQELAPPTRTRGKPLVLIGFMGSGKTTVGKELAKRLLVPFSDCDQLLSQHFGKSIPQVFKENGEAAFRKAEADILKTLCSNCAFAQESSNATGIVEKPKTDIVRIISTGGGACTNPQTVSLLLHTTLTVWLDADLDILLQRINGDKNRPLLNGDVEYLYNSRLASYEAAAHYRLDASRSPLELAEQIMTIILGFGSDLDKPSGPLGPDHSFLDT